MRSDYIPGELESSKHARLKERYYSGLSTIQEMGYEFEDFIHHFPCFCGHLTLARFLSLYECYRWTLGVSGHIAEVGVYRGSGSLFFGKLTEIFESNSLTQVHGFDWFQGTRKTEDASNVFAGSYCESYDRVLRLIKCQSLDHVIKIHKMDISKELEPFFDQNTHLQFKLVFMDAGQKYIMEKAIPLFWDRLTSGGIMIFDQFNFDIAPGETEAVKKHLPNEKIRTFPFGWMPTAYVVKE